MLPVGVAVGVAVGTTGVGGACVVQALLDVVAATVAPPVGTIRSTLSVSAIKNGIDPTWASGVSPLYGTAIA